MLYFPWKCKNMFLHIFWDLIADLLILIVINYDVCVFCKENIKKCFLCVAYGQYSNIFLKFLLKKTNIWSFENVFLHGFLKHNKKIIFLHFWILQHVCKTPKGIGQYSKKKKKSYFLGGEIIYYSPLMFG